MVCRQIAGRPRQGDEEGGREEGGHEEGLACVPERSKIQVRCSEGAPQVKALLDMETAAVV